MKRVVVMVGPTGVGKTSAGIALAQAIGGEILCADAFQIYRGLSIGTAKPTLAEQQGVPHHLMDLCEPQDSFSLSAYQAAAQEALRAVHARGLVPIVVGGTGLYIASLLSTYQVPAVAPRPGLRAGYVAYAEQKGAVALHARLAERDAEAAERIHPHNVRRVVRALEVSLLQATPPARRTASPYHFLGLQLTLPAAVLKERLRTRLESMLAAGWLAEMRWLRGRGANPSWQSMQAIGYKEWLRYLAHEQSWSEVLEAIERQTALLVKRQWTWWRRWPSWPQWEITSPTLPPDLLGYVTQASRAAVSVEGKIET